VADEVGLGKTIVAKEVARRMSEDGERPLVIYYIANGHAVSHQNKGASSASSTNRTVRRLLRRRIAFP
jgi:hypothetical protein